MEMQEPSEEMALQHKKERKDLQGKKLKASLGLHINQPALMVYMNRGVFMLTHSSSSPRLFYTWIDYRMGSLAVS